MRLSSSPFELGQRILKIAIVSFNLDLGWCFVDIRTPVTFLTLLAEIPRSPPCFDSIAASLINLSEFVNMIKKKF